MVGNDTKLVVEYPLPIPGLNWNQTLQNCYIMIGTIPKLDSNKFNFSFSMSLRMSRSLKISNEIQQVALFLSMTTSLSESGIELQQVLT